MKSNRMQIAFRNTILILALLASVDCKKEASNTSYSIRKGKLVIAEGGLNAREKSELDAKIIFLLPNYYFLEQFEEVGEELDVNDKKGKWTKIEYAGKTGYVFGGYLTNSTLDASEYNEGRTYYYNFFSTPEYGQKEPNNCTGNFKQAGCLVVVYEARSKRPINSLTDTVVEGWIDKDHLATGWSIGDAGYGGSGIDSFHIHTKDIKVVWKREAQTKINDGDIETDTLCLKEDCFDLKASLDVAAEIKKTNALKFYESGKYLVGVNEYSTEIKLGQNDSLIFYPNKNVVVRK